MIRQQLLPLVEQKEIIDAKVAEEQVSNNVGQEANVEEQSLFAVSSGEVISPQSTNPQQHEQETEELSLNTESQEMSTLFDVPTKALNAKPEVRSSTQTNSETKSSLGKEYQSSQGPNTPEHFSDDQSETSQDTITKPIKTSQSAFDW